MCFSVGMQLIDCPISYLLLKDAYLCKNKSVSTAGCPTRFCYVCEYDSEHCRRPVLGSLTSCHIRKNIVMSALQHAMLPRCALFTGRNTGVCIAVAGPQRLAAVCTGASSMHMSTMKPGDANFDGRHFYVKGNAKALKHKVCIAILMSRVACAGLYWCCSRSAVVERCLREALSHMFAVALRHVLRTHMANFAWLTAGSVVLLNCTLQIIQLCYAYVVCKDRALPLRSASYSRGRLQSFLSADD